MIRLEHVNLVVREIESTVDFLLTAFPHWKIRGRGEAPWHGKPRSWVHVGDQDYYITLNDNGVGENRDLIGHSTGLAHIGFVVDDADAIVERLQAKGYEVDIYGETHPYRKTFYFLDPAGFQFEFMQYLSEKDEERNTYSS